MTIRVAINGFGRIGRMVVRAANKNPNVDIVAINDLVPPDNLAYLLKYDSTHGKFDGDVQAEENGIVIGSKKIECSSEKNPADLPWEKLNVDYVIESTGLFITSEKDSDLRLLEAVCVQHEIDHLNGITIHDREIKLEPTKSEKKIGRNQLVTVKKGDAVKVLKYKKAQNLLNQG